MDLTGRYKLATCDIECQLIEACDDWARSGGIGSIMYYFYECFDRHYLFPDLLEIADILQQVKPVEDT